jgi:hypothetical protein
MNFEGRATAQGAWRHEAIACMWFGRRCGRLLRGRLCGMRWGRSRCVRSTDLTSRFW